MSWEYIIIIALISVSSGLITRHIASTKKKNTTEAFVAGMFFGIFAWSYYLFDDGHIFDEKHKTNKKITQKSIESKLSTLPVQQNYRTTEKGSMGTASLVCGILGLFLFPFILSTLAIIFGAIGMNRNEKHAQTGLILGIIGWVVMIIVMVFWMDLAVTAFSSFF